MFSNLCARKSHKNVKPKSAYMMILPDYHISDYYHSRFLKREFNIKMFMSRLFAHELATFDKILLESERNHLTANVKMSS